MSVCSDIWRASSSALRRGAAGMPAPRAGGQRFAPDGHPLLTLRVRAVLPSTATDSIVVLVPVASAPDRTRGQIAEVRLLLSLSPFYAAGSISTATTSTTVCSTVTGTALTLTTNLRVAVSTSSGTLQACLCVMTNTGHGVATALPRLTRQACRNQWLLAS